MATGNSSMTAGGAGLARALAWAALAFGVAWGPGSGFLTAAESPESPQAVLARRAERAYEEATHRFRSDTNSVAFAWQLGRAAQAWADFARSSRERETIARAGIAACRRALTLDPDSAGAHFYLGTNLGQLARARRLEALSLVREMERHFKAAQSRDELFNHAGPDRCLGLLYLDAPGWPASIGNRTRARERLERAVALCPTFPENRLCLMEAYLRWKDTRQLRLQFEAYEKSLSDARRRLAGEEWEGDWLDWDARWKRVSEQIRPLEP